MNKNLNHHLSIRKDSRCFVFQIIAQKTSDYHKKRCILDKFFEFQIFLSKGASYRFKSPDPFLPLETDHPTEQHPLVAMVDTQGSNVKPAIRRLRLKLHEANKTIRCFSLLFSARSWDDVHMYIYICIIHTYILYTIYIYSCIYIYICCETCILEDFFQKGKWKEFLSSDRDFSEAQKR